MADAAEHETRVLREDTEADLVPRPASEGTQLTFEVHVVLDGSSGPAQRLFRKALQEYGEKLATESARQEISSRAPGAHSTEITESAVIRGREALEAQAARRNRPGTKLEAVALATTPICTLAAGVAGSYLTSSLNWAVFGVLAVISISCVLYLLKRRLL
ncbi:hypothetical protein [Saccharopolyspora tripterygii]